VLLNNTVATDCRATAESNYLVTGETIVSPNYSLPSGVTVKGFKPYKNTSNGYSGMPDNLVWSEGTLGYVYLCALLGGTTLNNEAITYMDEILKLQNCTGSIGGVIHSTRAVTVGSGDDWDSKVWESVCPSAWLYLIINNPGVLFPNLSGISFPNITSGSVVYFNGTSFSLNPSPSSGTVTWEVTGTYSVSPITGNTTYITFAMAGIGMIRARINDIVVALKPISSPVVLINGPHYLNWGNTYYFSLPYEAGAYYDWSLSGT